MAFRTGHTTTVAGAGTVNRKTRTFTGKSKAPTGTRKIKAPRASEVPTVTTSPTGRVTTSNFSSPRAAVQAKQRSQAARRRVSRIERQQAGALAFHRRAQRRASERPPQPSTATLRKHDAPITTKTVISSKPLGGTTAGTPGGKRLPSYKPPKFQGAKTAGTPSLKELRAASSRGKLLTNRKGYITTPAVRETAGTLKRLKSKARRSNGLLPGLGPEESHVARKVLRTARRAGATRKEKLAAAETGLVESGFRNLPGGDADSEGWRQERASIFPNPRNVKAGAQRFFSEAKEQSGATAGELAANVQRPAEQYRGRYDEEKPKANAILSAFERGALKPAQQRKLAMTQLKARKLGLKVPDASSLGPAPKQVVTRFKAIKKAATALTNRHIPYVWGGGHGSIESAPSGLDCSGAVSWVLNKAGILKTPLTSGSMGEVLKPGPGAVTVFYNGEHTFMKIGDEYWGTSVGDSGKGGLGPHDAPSASYLAQYNVGHVPGLGKKQALQLGFSPTASESFPGMTISSSGTTATINANAGSIQEKAGFSKSPIKLTQAQKAQRTLKKLEQVGAGLSEKPSEGSESKASVLRDLERTYGKKAA